ncbi:hypothetical protein NFI96_014303 [Prochilodus magdalenae]|nr:hypothetical protein NFI96_014303 [Prochilodus magdalenae]
MEVSLQDQLFIPPPYCCGPLARIWGYCKEVDSTNKTFASTYTKWSSNYRKVVEVTLQHKAIYDGLESEHWWVLKNNFYTVRSLQLPPLYFATVRAVAYIKYTGTCISEAKISLHAETSDSSVQDLLLSTTVSIMSKGVHIDADGHFQYYDSNDAQTLESPAPVFSSGPRRPPPGF